MIGQASEPARVRLGASASTEPAILADLAGDSSATVRTALAMITATPPQVNEALVGDPNERVRVQLAHKLAALVPGLPASDQEQFHRETWDTLRALVADEAMRVCMVIAERVKELPHVPHDLILRLAADAEMAVAEPVIRLSPILSTTDLVALVVRAPAPDTARAVACHARLDAAVANVIAASADCAAIGALLANPSAQIREATLDALGARTGEHPDWHEPLVSRPALSPRAADGPGRARGPAAGPRREVLAAHRRAAGGARAGARGAHGHPPRNRHSLRRRPWRGRASWTRGRCWRRRVHAVSLRSAKGIVCLVWKAGFSMRAAVALQPLLARIAPHATLVGGPAESVPLSIEEMRWQVDFLRQRER